MTASIMNSAVRDNFSYIKGIGQVPTVQSGLTIDNSLGSERLLLPLLSTAECTTVLNAEGEVAFDEQTHQMKEYDGTAIRIVLSEADVDDTPTNGATTIPVSSNWAYDFQQTLTTVGDIPYATAAGVWARLAGGTLGYVLTAQGAGVAPIYSTIAAAVSAGNYTGDSSQNRGIPHGLGKTPKAVFLLYRDGNRIHVSLNGQGEWQYAGDSTGKFDCTAPDATNFYVGDANPTYRANLSPVVYDWAAFG